MNKAFLAAVVIGQLAVGHAFAGERAATSDGLPRVAVQYGDLNVDSDAGRRALTSRLTRAARSVCPDADARDLRTRSAGQSCIRKSVADALSIVGEQRLAQANKQASQRS
jgi:UrcA family protein